MASLPSLLVNAVTTFDGKALTKGSKQIGGFEKGIKSLGKTLAATFGTTALLKFGKDSVKAFAENEKSALRLATVVKNLGLAFEVPQIEKGLDEISARYGYQGEVLREAFQKLLTVTGSAAKSQDLLNLSLSVAAGSGQDLLTVNQDLAAVYVGNTKGLRKYNLGLAQSELKTLKFDDAVALLTKTFKGSADAELTTFSGKMKVLGEAAGNAQEIIGGGLVKSLSLLAGEGNSVQPLADSMQEVATNTSEVIVGIGVLAQKLKDLPAIGKSFSFVFSKNNPGLLSLLGRLGETELGKNTIGDKQLGGLERRAAIEANAKARAKAERDALARAKALAALQTKSLATDKAKLALSKAGSVLDTTRISIAAALKGKISETDRLSLNLQLALLNENEGQATKLAKQLEAAVKRQNELSAALLATPEAPNPYANWKMPVMTMPSVPLPEGLVKDTLVSLGVPSIGDIPSLNTGGLSDAELDVIDAVTRFMELFPDGIAGATSPINVMVVLDGDPIAGAVSEVQTNNNLSGSFTTVGGRGANTARFT